MKTHTPGPKVEGYEPKGRDCRKISVKRCPVFTVLGNRPREVVTPSLNDLFIGSREWDPSPPIVTP